MTGTVCDAGLHQTVDVVKLKHSLKEEVFLMNKRFECCEEHSSFRTWRESQVTGTSKKKKTVNRSTATHIINVIIPCHLYFGSVFSLCGFIFRLGFILCLDTAESGEEVTHTSTGNTWTWPSSETPQGCPPWCRGRSRDPLGSPQGAAASCFSCLSAKKTPKANTVRLCIGTRDVNNESIID